ncbi:hypothetical protein RMCBS344292_08491 [Rhizopus microsporus]|nr:hypothetical protein RMCBS344292_08491 [Rhizopus microsporus]
MEVVRYYHQKQGLSEAVMQMLQQKNRKNPTQAYNECWMQGADPLSEDTGLVVEYLASLSKCSKSHLNSIRLGLVSVYNVVHSERSGLEKDIFVQEFFQSVKIQIPYFLSVQKRKAKGLNLKRI